MCVPIFIKTPRVWLPFTTALSNQKLQSYKFNLKLNKLLTNSLIGIRIKVATISSTIIKSCLLHLILFTHATFLIPQPPPHHKILNG